MKLFKSSDNTLILRGIDLCIAEKNPDTLIYFLSDPSYVSGMIFYHFIPLFQKDKELWEKIRGEIPENMTCQIERWLDRTILALEKPSVETFCDLANLTIQKYFKTFPVLKSDILTEEESYSFASIRSGKSITDGIGWALYIESRSIGPAEVIDEEEWTATAHHPQKTIEISRLASEGSFDRVWMEERLPV